MKGYDDIRQALHKVFMIPKDAWLRIPQAPFNTDSKNEILAMTARDLELSAFSFSSSSEFYQYKIIAMADAVRMLAQPKPWDNEDEHFDNAQEALQALERLCVAYFKKTSRKH